MVSDTLLGNMETGSPFPSRLLLRWLGAAGLELRAGDQTLLIDPFLSRPGLWDTVRGRLQPDGELLATTLGPVDQVLVTHAHWDHLLDTPEILRQTGAVAYGSANTCRLLAACGLPPAQIRPIEAGQRLQLGRFSVDVLLARHMSLPGFGPQTLTEPLAPPRRARDYRMDTCFSFHLQVGGLSLLDWTSQDPEPAPGRPPPRADLLLVKMVGRRGLHQRLIAAVQPGVVVPVHWDNPFRPLSGRARPLLDLPWPNQAWLDTALRRLDPERFRRWLGARAPGLQVMIPEPLRWVDVVAMLQEIET